MRYRALKLAASLDHNEDGVAAGFDAGSRPDFSATLAEATTSVGVDFESSPPKIMLPKSTDAPELLLDANGLVWPHR